MNTVEDLVNILHTAMIHHPNRVINNWDSNFINDVATKIDKNGIISTGQASVALKLFLRYKHLLVEYGVPDYVVEQIAKSPTYKQSPYQSHDIPREVRHIGGDFLAFRMKFNTNIVSDIKKARSENEYGLVSPIFEPTYKLWVVEVSEMNVNKIESIITRYKFGYDDAVTNLLFEVETRKNRRSVVDFDMNTGMILVSLGNDDMVNSYIMDMMNGVLND
jgi:hypothetical protein